MEQPLVSCIIATHNDGRYLNESISSILDQTYGNIECIVIDDGSTDDTASIVEQWHGDPKFTCIHQAKSGVAKARNAGAQRSTGSYIAFLDADDRWDVNKIESQLQFLLDHPEFKFCWSDQEQMDALGKPLGKRIEVEPEYPMTTQILTSGWCAPPSCWLLSRRLFEQTGGFDESLPSGQEDVELIFRMADLSLGARSAKALTWRRVRPDSISRNVKSKRMQVIQTHKKMLSYDNGKYSRLRRQAMHAAHRILAGHCWENGAFWGATVEAIWAAFWNPAFVLDRGFVDTVALGHLNRLIKRTTSGEAKSFA